MEASAFLRDFFESGITVFVPILLNFSCLTDIQWTLDQLGVRGDNFPCNKKSSYNLQSALHIAKVPS